MPYRFKTLLILFIFITPTAFSWDGTGHRIISAIAYNHLTPETKQKIDALTAVSDPSYPALSRFLYVSTLPDKWRQNDHGQSANWHFIDTPWSADGTPIRPPAAPNLITMLQINRAMLLNPHSTSAQKAAALAYVIHLTEDAHQPLHCINRFSKEFPQGDKGGNLFPIKTRYADNLHAYWDQSARQMKTSNQHYPFNNKQILQLAQTIQTNYPKSVFGSGADDFSAVDWAAESYAIAQQKAYGLAPTSKPLTAYKKILRETAARQMALAGYRLAGLLNQLF